MAQIWEKYRALTKRLENWDGSYPIDPADAKVLKLALKLKETMQRHGADQTLEFDYQILKEYEAALIEVRVGDTD